MFLKEGIYLVKKTPNQISVRTIKDIKLVNYILISKESRFKPEYVSIKNYMGEILIIPNNLMKSICEIEFVHETDLKYLGEDTFKKGCNVLPPEMIQDIALKSSFYLNFDLESYDNNAYCHIFYKNEELPEKEEEIIHIETLY